MTQAAVDDTFIGKARAVTNLETGREILEEALRGFILDMKMQSEVKQYCGKLNWDGDWSGGESGGDR